MEKNSNKFTRIESYRCTFCDASGRDTQVTKHYYSGDDFTSCLKHREWTNKFLYDYRREIELALARIKKKYRNRLADEIRLVRERKEF